ncbi:MAG TPA: hypothetical protein VG389_14380 [Myxococcota bacterium]|jgi:hypothetical protein|nr:hypothetical protein [Myxococcota bacterium]
MKRLAVTAALLVASCRGTPAPPSSATAAPAASGAAALAAAVDALELSGRHAAGALALPGDIARAEADADVVLDLAAGAPAPPAPGAPAADTMARAGDALRNYVLDLIAGSGVGAGPARLARTGAVLARMRLVPVLADSAATLDGARAAAARALAARVNALASDALRAADYDRLTRLDGLLDALARGAPGAPDGGDAEARTLRARLDGLRTAIYGPGTAPLRLGVERFRVLPDAGLVEATVWLRREEPAGQPPLIVDPRAVRLVGTTGAFDLVAAAKPTPRDLGGGALAARGELSGRVLFPIPPAGADTIRAVVWSPPGGRPPVERALARPFTVVPGPL